MKRAQSIRARLSLLFLFMFLLVIVLGVESLRSLAFVNDASAQIRVRWLPSTRALGDLNNLTTDFPAAESAYARADGDAERSEIARSLAEHDAGIAAAMSAYAQIRHDPAEEALYARFTTDWRRYRTLTAASAGSTDAYRAASETLGKLTDRNLASAREASERSERAYGEARDRILVTICLAGLFVVGAMLQVARSISAPLVDLAARMHRLAADETSLEIAGTRRQDEIGEMARAVVVFRNNAIDLADKRRALAEQTHVLEQKLAEEQRVTLLQRNFVAMASHEFRSPLAIIDGHAQRLISMRERLTGEELADRANRVRNAVRRMTQLIENLIGSAR
jgi:HAMP domain-containing protein